MDPPGVNAFSGSYHVNCCCFSPDGRTVLAGYHDKRECRLIDATTGATRRVLSGHSCSVTGCAFSPDGVMAVTSSSDKTLKLWLVAEGTCTRTLEGHTGRVTCVTWSPDGELILSGGADHVLRLWHASSGECRLTISGHTQSVRCCCFAPDGTTLLSGSADKMLKLWSTAGDCVATLEGHRESVVDCCFSPDGLAVLSCSPYDTTRLWDIGPRACRWSLYGQGGVDAGECSGPVVCRLSPCGRYALTGSYDCSAKLWDLTTMATGDCVATFWTGRDGRWGECPNVESVAFSPDGQAIAVGSVSLKLWQRDGASG